MKTTFFILIITLCSISSLWAKKYTLPEAILNKIVEHELVVFEKGTHYTIQFLLKIKNISSEKIEIVVEPGLLYISEEDPYQNFINTKHEAIILAKGENQEIQIHAMCIESSDRAPSDSNIYKVGTFAEGKLLDLAKMINEKAWYQKSEAQDAIWAITDRKPIYEIMGAEDEVVENLVEFVSEATGQPIPLREDYSGYEYDYHSTDYQVKINGNFEYKISKTSTITIGMFNVNNILVRELFYNQEQKPGNHKFDFAFDATVYTDQFYYFKLLQDGIVQIEIEYQAF